MTEDAEIPDWIEILQRPPLQPKLSDENIIDEFCVRLAALFECYHYELPPGGCPEIILGLAREHLPAFQIEARKKLPVSGAPIKQQRWAVRAQAMSELRKLERAAERAGLTKRGLQRRAAEKVFKTNRQIENNARRKHKDDPAAQKWIRKTPSIKTIQNLMAAKIPFPAAMEPDPASERAKVLLWRAAERMQRQAHPQLS